MKTIIDNLAIEYDIKGDGKTLLFLHGWGDDNRTFDNLISQLGDSFKIVRLDLPGFGASEAPSHPWDLDDYINFLNDFLIKNSITPDVIIGHSFGGRITIKGVGSNKFNPEKIILLSSAGINKSKTIRSKMINLNAKIFGFILTIPPLSFKKDIIRKKFYKLIGSDYLSAGLLQETFKNIIREDLQTEAKKITLPTLLIWGKDDQETPLGDGKLFNQLIKNSRLEVIDSAGHFVHREQSEKVADLIKNFVC